jgi:2-polyprenyl-6-methoxyphenol hydroxylase-like FAD-dependent oxidoreductase
VDIDRYHAGRVVLLGDAGYGNTLGGFGTGLAIVGAYVLAGELPDYP